MESAQSELFFGIKFEMLLSRKIGRENGRAQLPGDRVPAALDKIKYKFRNCPYILLNENSNLGLRHPKLSPNFLLKEIFSSSGVSKMEISASITN